MSTRTVVFDMDGTLVQSRGAAWAVFQETIAAFDLPMHEPEQFFDLFRHNFFDALRNYVADPARYEAVAEHFLAALRRSYTPELIPGMADIVHSLAGHYSLAVMSSNAMDAIRRTMQHAGVAQCFAHVFSGDVESDKKAGIRRILADPSYGTIRRCAPDYVEEGTAPPAPTAAEVVLVTDTVGDVKEGVACGIRVIGVAWGMHSADDLTTAGAEFVALWPQELIARLLPGGSCSPGGCACLNCALPAAAARDVKAEAIAAGELRRTRRQPRSTRPPSRGCGCDGPSCKDSERPRTEDPHLRYALSIIAIGGKSS